MDRRSRADKLRAMAADTSSPNEAAIASRLLEGMTEPSPIRADLRLDVEVTQTDVVGGVEWDIVFHAHRG